LPFLQGLFPKNFKEISVKKDLRLPPYKNADKFNVDYLKNDPINN